MNKFNTRERGFTIVEVVVTIVVATIFIIAITQLFIAQMQLSAAQQMYVRAEQLAYNNLRTYANSTQPTWFECINPGLNPQVMTLINRTNSSGVDGIEGPVIELVQASAPYGCGTPATTGTPIKIVSTITYGRSGKSIVHATYSSY